MYLRKKIRKRLLIAGLILFSIVFYRGLKATTEKTHDCEFKIIYAACVEKAKTPSCLACGTSLRPV